MHVCLRNRRFLWLKLDTGYCALFCVRTTALGPVSSALYGCVLVSVDRDRWVLDPGAMGEFRDPRRDSVVRQLLHVSDEEMQSQQPMLRGLVLQRLEAVYQACEPHINGDVFPVDVRFVQLGAAVLKQMTALGRLDRWGSTSRSLETDADVRATAIEGVDRGLRELEAKRGG